MYILILSYLRPLTEVDKHLDTHKLYLEKHYSLGKFIASGRRNPRIGGIIICMAESKNEVEKIINEDPFYIHQIASYEVIEFEPTKYAEGFERFI